MKKRKKKIPKRLEDAREDPPKIAARKRSVLPFAVGLGAVAAVFLIFKMFSMHPYLGDEHIYLYQAKMVADGFAPYSDFPMAHPPLQALLTAPLVKILGYGPIWTRLLPSLWCLAAGVILALAVRRELGTTAAVIAAALYLLAYEPLRASSHFTGVNMSTALLLLAFLLQRSGRLIPCAALCAAAVFTRLYTIPGVMVLVLWTFASSPGKGLKLVAWGAGFGVLGFLGVGLWAGFSETVHHVLAYHASKTPMAPEKLADMKANVLFHNAVPAAFFAASIPALLVFAGRGWRRVKDERRVLRRLRRSVTSQGIGLPLLAASAAVFFQLILLNMDRVWMYYFVPAFPFAAVSGGWLASKLIFGLVETIRGLARERRLTVPLRHLAPGLLAAIPIASAFLFGHRLEARLDYWADEMKKAPEKRVHTYDWTDAPLPGFVNSLVRATVWSDERTIGEPYCQLTYLLWHESRYFDILDDMVEAVVSRTEEGDEIFGDSGSVPLLALAADRDIAGGEVDTNIQRYRSGSADPEELIDKIDKDSTKLIVLRRRFGVAGLAELRGLTRKKYEMVQQLRSKQGRIFQVLERRGGEGRP